MQKLMPVLLTSLFVLSQGALAADTHKCAEGKVYQTEKKMCVKKEDACKKGESFDTSKGICVLPHSSK